MHSQLSWIKRLKVNSDKFEVVSTEAAEAMICACDDNTEVFDSGASMSYLIHKDNGDKVLLVVPVVGAPFIYRHQ